MFLPSSPTHLYLSIHLSFLISRFSSLTKHKRKTTISLQKSLSLSLSISFTLCTSPTIVTATLQFLYIKTYSYQINKESTRCVCFQCCLHLHFLPSHHSYKELCFCSWFAQMVQLTVAID